MYARSYYPEKDPETGIPKNYGGTALREPPAPEVPPPEAPPAQKAPGEPAKECDVECNAPPANKNPWELPPPKKGHGGIFDSLFGTLLPKEPGGIFSTIGTWLTGEKKGADESRLSTEDLLILAVAAVLFFSKFGDKECALMLLFLLFIRP